VDQGTVEPRVAHALRLVLITLGAVLGLLLLGAILGGTSASAAPRDDQPTLGGVVGGVVSEVVDAVEPATELVAPVTHPIVTSPVVAPAVEPVLETVRATQPAVEAIDQSLGEAIAPVLDLLDRTLVVGTGLVPPAVDLASPEPDAAPAVLAVTSPASGTAGAAFFGIATGTVPLGPAGAPDDPAVAAFSANGVAVSATLLGVGAIAVMALRRRPLPVPVVPGSPVFDTDASPD
jgi:hypothetical protein